jgi:hypothetical protein
MLLRNLNPSDQAASSCLQELSEGLPTIAAFARLCGRAISGDVVQEKALSPEALALLAAGGDRGMFEIRGDRDAFESADRFLAICVEVEAERRLLFRNKSNPRQTMLFLDGFRQLCQAGLVMHHLLKDFSLTTQGFELAERLDRNEFQKLIDFAIEVEH